MEKPTAKLPEKSTSLLPKSAAANHETGYSTPKRPPPQHAGAGNSNSGSDRLRRDEWSEGAVSTLLEAYESKWVLRNRAKLKGQDWEDVALHVSSRAGCTKSPKTQTQCKNKIESMKKRYRSESGGGGPAPDSASSWPLFRRLDLLLRGNGGVSAPGGLLASPPPPLTNPPLVIFQTSPLPQQQPLPPPPPTITAQNSHHSTGVDPVNKVGVAGKISNHVPEKVPTAETDSSTPALYGGGDENREYRSREANTARKITDKKKKKKRRRRQAEEEEEEGGGEEEEGDDDNRSGDEGYYWEIADSVRWLAEVVTRSEKSRMDMMRDLERIRMEAETKRAEIELKRTEVIANTQLEIARLFAGSGVAGGGGGGGNSVDSSLRIGRN